jgi:putative phosphoribosyl transferase
MKEAQEDEITERIRFDIPLLTQRVIDAIDFSQKVPEIADLMIATFGASTGASGKI